jgi:hypothetical protein
VSVIAIIWQSAKLNWTTHIMNVILFWDRDLPSIFQEANEYTIGTSALSLKESFNIKPSVGKEFTHSWDVHGIFFKNYCEKGTIVNSIHYSKMFCEQLRSAIQIKHKGLVWKVNAILHYTTHLHAHTRARARIHTHTHTHTHTLSLSLSLGFEAPSINSMAFSLQAKYTHWATTTK